MKQNSPIFLKKDSTKSILSDAINCIPEGTEVYLFGGAVRNALYFSFFEEEMTQRDFDCIVIGDGEMLAKNLSDKGFIFGSKNSEKSKVLKKERISNPLHQYNDWLYLDCKIYTPEENIQDILARISDFTISGVAMNIKDIFSENWLEKIIAIPYAKEDIKDKKLRVVKPYAISLHKIIRMVSQNFEKPSKEDIALCIEKLKELTEEKFIANTEKTIRYVGSKDEVQKISNGLGISFDILNFNEIKSL